MKEYDEARKCGEKSFRNSTGKRVLDRMCDSVVATMIDPKTGRVIADFLQEISCPICLVDNPHFLFVKNGLNYVRCASCGLVYINPQPTLEALERVHNNPEIAEHFVARVLASPVQLDFDQRKFADAVTKLAKLIPSGGNIIDVGCSSGSFLYACSTRGFLCRGVEVSEVAARYGRERFGLDIDNTTWEEAPILPASADGVSFWASHSYITEPVAALEKAHRVLKPSGVLMMLVDGNPNSLMMRVLHEKCVGFEFCRLWYFPPRTMIKLLARIGFSILSVESIIHTLDPVLNYLDYEPPHDCDRGHFQLEKKDAVMLMKYLKDNLMGYKYEVIARKDNV